MQRKILELEKGDPSTLSKIEDEIQRTINEDQAEPVVLGCAGMADMLKRLSEKFGLPSSMESLVRHSRKVLQRPAREHRRSAVTLVRFAKLGATSKLGQRRFLEDITAKISAHVNLQLSTDYPPSKAKMPTTALRSSEPIALPHGTEHLGPTLVDR